MIAKPAGSWSAPGIDGWIKRRVARAAGIALDAAAIARTGTANQPLGVLHTPLVGVQIMGPNGATITVAALQAMEKALSDQNAVATALPTTTGVRQKLRALPSITSGTEPVWDGDNKVLGYTGAVSTQVPSNLTKGITSGVSACHAIILGDRTNLLVCEWGILELVVDQYTAKKTRMIEVTSYGMYDITIVCPSAFMICVDALV